MSISNKLHWEKIYETKTPDQVSWTQVIPEISLEFIHSIGLSKNASIIDIGGGDSNFVDYLLDKGFINITILDISSTAIERAKKRLGSRAEKINWIVSDINEYIPHSNFDLWHDRAAVSTAEQIQRQDSKAARWIAADALRELRSDAVRQRLAK